MIEKFKNNPNLDFENLNKFADSIITNILKCKSNEEKKMLSKIYLITKLKIMIINY